MTIEIYHAKDMGESVKAKISALFVEGFGQWLHFFSKDDQKLTRAFEHMFNLEVLYLAVIDGEIAGMTGCAAQGESSVKLNGNELRRHLGFVSGTLASIFLKREFEKPPMKTGERVASVEFVATAAKYRGQGVATAIMKHIFTFSQYDSYVLEVADTNTSAVKLYEKLGYREFHRIKQKNSKQSGINYLVYMEYVKQNKSSGG